MNWGPGRNLTSFCFVRDSAISMSAPTPIPTDETELRNPSTNPEPADGQERRSGIASEPPARANAPREVNLFGSDGREVAEIPADPDAPLSFVPHTAVANTVRPQPLRIRTGRFGELEEHELVKLIDSIEDERARARFRESVYLSIFVWIAVALVVFFGPKYLWHAPRVVLPSEVLRAREVTELTDPTLNAPHVHAAPPRVDSHTLEHLRNSEPRVAPTPQPRAAPPPPPTPRAEVRPEPRTQSAVRAHAAAHAPTACGATHSGCTSAATHVSARLQHRVAKSGGSDRECRPEHDARRCTFHWHRKALPRWQCCRCWSGGDPLRYAGREL